MGAVAFFTPLAYLWILWAIYMVVMGLYRAHLDDRLSLSAKVLGAPFLALGLLMDVIGNWTLAWLVFLEPPQEFLVTKRLNRHLRSGSGWRYAVARWLCHRLLDPFDPTGAHCK